MKNNLSIVLGERKQRVSDVVKETGVSRNLITNMYYERDCNPNYKTLEKVCDYLGITVSEFLKEEVS